MDTPSNNTLTKLAATERGAAEVSRLIVESLLNYTELQHGIQRFIKNPGDEAAQYLDDCFANCETRFERIRAAVASVATIAIEANQADEEVRVEAEVNEPVVIAEDEIEGNEEEDGIRLM